MKRPVHLKRAAPMLCLLFLLAACGGSGEADAPPARQQSETVLPGEPVPEAIGMPFITLYDNGRSQLAQDRQVVVRDQAAWSALWAEHNAGLATPQPLPVVDFSSKMVLGVILGKNADCFRQVRVRRIGLRAGRLLAEYTDTLIGAAGLCQPDSTSPIHLVTVERSDIPVDFVNIAAASIDFATIDSGTQSNIVNPENAVARDAAGWGALWARHSTAPRPTVDFSKKMVLAVFAGSRPSPCHGIAIGHVYRDAGGIRVLYRNFVPKPGVACAAVVASPIAHMVQVDHSAEPVKFVEMAQ